MKSHDSPSAPEEKAAPAWAQAFTPGRLALGIGLLLLTLYPGVVTGSRTFFYQDYGLFTYPNAHYARASFLHGEWPLWNPLSRCGVPFLAQWNTTVCYPLSLIYLLLPMPWSLNLFGFVHLILAGLGMYFLALNWTQSRLAATLAGLGFAMSGMMLNCLLWTNNLAAMTWLPWVVLSTEGAWRGGWRRMALAASAGAMQMLAGVPEIILFTWLIVAVLWIAAWRRNEFRLGAGLMRFAFVVLMVAGLAAFQIMPFLDLLVHSERDTGYAQSDYWPVPLWGWVNFIAPIFRATETVVGTYHLPGQYWIKSYYPGIGLLALALVGARRAGARGWLLAGIAVIGLWLSFGNDGLLYAWLKRVVPAMGVARFPVKFIVAPVFALPLLAAFAFNNLQIAKDGIPRTICRTMIWIGLGFSMVAAGALWMEHQFPRPEEDWSALRSSTVLRVIFLALTIGTVCGFCRARSAHIRARSGLALLLLTGLDLTTAGARMHPTVATRAYGSLDLNMSSLPRPGKSRALVTGPADHLLNHLGNSDPLLYCTAIRGALYQNSHLLVNIPKVDGFCSIGLKESPRILAALDASTNLFRSKLADFLCVSQVLTSDDLFVWRERPGALPLVTAGQSPVFVDDTTALARIQSDDFNPLHEVFLPSSARSEVTASGQTAATVTNLSFSAHRIRMETAASSPAMVVIAQSYYHNWHAYVDGHPVPLWKANYAFQALEVPSGRHKVELRYRDRAFQVGAVLSGLLLILCVTLLAVGGQRGTSRRATE